MSYTDQRRELVESTWAPEDAAVQARRTTMIVHDGMPCETLLYPGMQACEVWDNDFFGAAPAGGGPSNLTVTYTDATDAVVATVTTTEGIVLAYTDATDAVTCSIATTEGVSLIYSDGDDAVSATVATTEGVSIVYNDGNDAISAVVATTEGIALAYSDGDDAATVAIATTEGLALIYSDGDDPVVMEMTSEGAPPVVTDDQPFGAFMRRILLPVPLEDEEQILLAAVMAISQR